MKSMDWRHTFSPVKKNFKSAHSAGKIMLILFWDTNGPVLEPYQEKGETVNNVRYSAMLEGKLKFQFAVVVAGFYSEASFFSMRVRDNTLLL
jgi:hypothetical protein